MLRSSTGEENRSPCYRLANAADIIKLIKTQKNLAFVKLKSKYQTLQEKAKYLRRS